MSAQVVIRNFSDQNPFIGMAALTRMIKSGADISGLINAAASNPNNANMLMGLSIIFQLMGNREMGMELQGRALNIRQLYHLPAAEGQPEIRLLAILRPGDMMDNTPVDFLLEGSGVALDLLYVSLDLPSPTELPDHDVLMVAIAQSDMTQPLLDKVARLIKSSSRPTINRPDRISRLSRNCVSDLLKPISGIEIPHAVRIDRQGLHQICSGEKSVFTLLGEGDFPIIVRPVASQGGQGLAKIDGIQGLGEYLVARSENDFYVARFVDYRGPDGLYRKCRIAVIDGQPFACHLAISGNWMIHYRTAGMSESESKRAEEASFMRHFDDDFGLRHQKSFRAIAQILGLDYLVIDCGETQAGKLLVFEADNLGFVHALDPVDVFPYKQPQMRKVFTAFQAMLKRKVPNFAG